MASLSHRPLSFLNGLRGGDRARERRARDLATRLGALQRAARRGSVPPDHRAFLVLALERLGCVLQALPPEVRRQELSLSWQESILESLERQSSSLVAASDCFAPGLPTTRAEEERRLRARAVLEEAGDRLTCEREEILAAIAEVEHGLREPSTLPDFRSR